MRDYYTNTEADAGRWEAQHADRSRDFDAAEEGPLHRPRPIPAEVRATVRKAYDDLMIPCGICDERLWSKQAAKVHREKVHGA